MSSRELGVSVSRSFCAVRMKPSSAVVGTTTGSAPARRHISGYETQYGAGMMTSSPGPHTSCKGRVDGRRRGWMMTALCVSRRVTRVARNETKRRRRARGVRFNPEGTRRRFHHSGDRRARTTGRGRRRRRARVRRPNISAARHRRPVVVMCRVVVRVTCRRWLGAWRGRTYVVRNDDAPCLTAMTPCATDCLAPLLRTISLGAYLTPFSSASFSHTAARSPAVPVLGEYRVFPPRIAAQPASTIAEGVSKSGSPAARPMTSCPASFMLRARSVSAIVLDSRSDATRGFKPWSTCPSRVTSDADALEGPGTRRGPLAKPLDGLPSWRRAEPAGAWASEEGGATGANMMGVVVRMSTRVDRRRRRRGGCVEAPAPRRPTAGARHPSPVDTIS